jgi:glycosyltransferase involved in cell wall biosynthesis
LVRQKVNCDLYVVGTNQVKTIWDMESDYVHIIGRVNDLTSYYNRCRLFVVPTRYSAGIPLKLLEAAAHGVPAVVTPLTADQLGWQENRDFLVGATPKDFASKVIDIYSNQDIFYSLRQNALDRIREEYSPEVFSKKLVHVLNLALHEKEEGEISALIS